MTGRCRHVRLGVITGCLVVLCALGVTAQQITRRLFVAVQDLQGVPVLDLREFEFAVTENGAPAQIQRARLSRDPMRIVLIVDSSAATASALVDLRTGLQAFVNAIPEEHEIAFVTIGSQPRVRAQPNTDRQRLRQLIAEFAPDGGRTALLDGVREADQRFMQRLEDGRWPVFVIMTTDGPEGSGSTSNDQYVRLVQGMLLKGASVHAVVLQAPDSLRSDLAQIQPRRNPAPLQTFDSTVPDRTPDAGEIALNLTGNMRGSYESVMAASGLTDKLRALGQRIFEDHRLMSARYEIEYRGSANLAVGASVSVTRQGLQVASSPRRPF